MLTTLYLGDNKLETKGALDIAAGLSAVSQGCSLRTLELRHNGLALEAGDAFGSLLAGARMPCPASPPHPPQHAASRRSRVAGKAGPATLAALASGHLSASAATSASAASPLPSSRQQLQHMTTSGGSMPGSAAGSMRHRMGTAAVLAGHPSAQPLAGGAAVASGSCRDLSTSSPRPGTVPGQPLLSPAAVPSGLPVAAAALPESLQAIGSEGVSVLEQQQQQQLEAELMLVSACHLTTLDLGCNPLLGDVGVCKLAAGLAIHCRRYGRLRELLLDACGVGAEGTAALVAAIVQQPPQQQQMGQSQDEQQLRKQRKQHHQREQQQLGQLRNSSAGALKTSLDGTGNRGSFAGEKGALSSGVITSSDAGMLGASISGSVAVSAAARPGKGLLSLELSNNAIGKQGLHALSGAVPLMATLQELLLRDCQIDTDGRLTLLAALQLYTGCPLRHLDLRGNGINPAEYTPPPVLDPPHHLPHVSAIPDSLAHFSSSHHPSGPKAFPTGPVNTASPHALCTDDQGRSLSPSSLGPKQVGLRQFKELLCASQGLDHQGQDGSQHEDDENAGMDTDRIDLTGGQDGGLNTTRRTASAEVATKGRMVEGLSRHERDLAQSLNLARKLRAAPRGMLIEM
uniref:Uncharacterized protein n=3 Tax=Dunaliella tertiolecta TaxID=3047 RepID=A0A7S3QW33_DUNTE